MKIFRLLFAVFLIPWALVAQNPIAVAPNLNVIPNNYGLGAYTDVGNSIPRPIIGLDTTNRVQIDVAGVGTTMGGNLLVSGTTTSTGNSVFTGNVLIGGTLGVTGTTTATGLGLTTLFKGATTVPIFKTGTPVVAGNGTIVANSMDSAGKVLSTVTAGATITVTFSSAFTRAPACFASNETTANLALAASTTTVLTITGVTVTGDSLSYGCLGF